MASKEADPSVPELDIWSTSGAGSGEPQHAVRCGLQPCGDVVMPHEPAGDEPDTGGWSGRLQSFAEAIRPTPAQRAEERRIIADALRRVHGERSARSSSSSS